MSVKRQASQLVFGYNLLYHLLIDADKVFQE
jgi:hypothetical protein